VIDLIEQALSNLYDEFDDGSDEYADFFLEVYSYMVDEELILEVPDKECDDITKNEWINGNIHTMRQFIKEKYDSNLE